MLEFNRYIPFLILVSIIIGWLGIGMMTQTASFDCSKVQTKVEHLICNNQKLSKLDDALAKTYSEATKKANDAEKQRLLTEQKHWLAQTRNICESKDCLSSDYCVIEVCIMNAYWSRQAELETFFLKQSPLYRHESDKTEAIIRLLLTEPLYAWVADEPFCGQLLNDLKLMKNIRFVDPILQTKSYQDPILDKWKRQCSDANTPLNLGLSCPISSNGEEYVDINGRSGVCGVGFGLPPFKLFELPPLISSGKTLHVFYSDDDYGPMNQDWIMPETGQSSAGGFDRLDFPNCVHRRQSKVSISNNRNDPNYNSIIEYQNRYYLLSINNNLVEIEPVIQKKPHERCLWGPVRLKQDNK